MKTTDHLADVERRAYRSTFDDGIYDIQFGLVFLILGLIPVLETIGVSRYVGYFLLITSSVLNPWLGKRYLTIPRMGAVAFGPKRKTRNRLLLAIGAGVLILMLPLIIDIVRDNGPRGLGWPMIAMIVAPVVVVSAYAMDFPRLFIYVGLLLFATVESEFLLEYVSEPWNTVISFELPGVIISAIGLTLLCGFIKKYPKEVSEVDHVS